MKLIHVFVNSNLHAFRQYGRIYFNPETKWLLFQSTINPRYKCCGFKLFLSIRCNTSWECSCDNESNNSLKSGYIFDSMYLLGGSPWISQPVQVALNQLLHPEEWIPQCDVAVQYPGRSNELTPPTTIILATLDASQASSNQDRFSQGNGQVSHCQDK